jgi:hypothetical protein
MLSACGISQAKRDSFESDTNQTIGHSIDRKFADVPWGEPGVTCHLDAERPGCLHVSKGNCRVWYDVDRVTRRILGWKYEGRAENCWKVGYGG